MVDWTFNYDFKINAFKISLRLIMYFKSYSGSKAKFEKIVVENLSKILQHAFVFVPYMSQNRL